MNKKSSAGYRLLNIYLIESLFKRDISVDLNEAEVDSEVDIDVEDQESENHVSVSVTITFSAGSNKKKGIDASITMIGLFESPDNPELSIKDFGKINGPAIIFPFIREHLATVSMKSGISPILLPPINFVKLSEEKKKGKK